MATPDPGLIDSSTTPFQSPFLGSYNDVVIYISCIFGILGAVLIVALAFFILEHCGFMTSQADARARSIMSKHDKLLREAESRTYPVVYGEKIKPVRSAPPSHAATDRTPDKSQEAALNYINHVFSDIDDEFEHITGNGDLKRIAYDPNEVCRPDIISKPAVTVAYEKYRKEVDGPDMKKSNGIKVPMAGEQVDYSEPERRNPILSVAMDDYDPKAERREEEQRREEEGKSKVQVKVQMEETVVPDKPVYKSQSIMYEDPKIAKQQRAEEQRRQEELKKQESKNRKSKRIVVEGPNALKEEKAPVKIIQPQRKIPIQRKTSQSPTSKTPTSQSSTSKSPTGQSSKDSFTYFGY